jgi:hypothetical protein
MAGFILLAIIGALTVLGAFAARWGVDSRDNFSDAYRTVGPIGLH